MRIVLAALAEAANVSVNGHLNVLGCFDTLFASQFPCRHPGMVLVFRLLGEYEDQHRARQLKVWLTDADGNKYWEGAAEVRLANVAPGQFSHNNQIIAFRDVHFPHAGRYRFRIQLDDDVPTDVVFHVVKLPEGNPSDS